MEILKPQIKNIQKQIKERIVIHKLERVSNNKSIVNKTLKVHF